MKFLFGVKYSSLWEYFIYFFSVSLFFSIISLTSCLLAASSRKNLFIFDRQLKQLIVNNSKIYELTEIMCVRSVSTRGNDMGPLYWREIHVVLRSGKIIKLHPGHDDPDNQRNMTTLIRAFLHPAQELDNLTSTRTRSRG
jgi:hypothetical protein